MARRKQKTEPKEVVEDDDVIETYNDIDGIETVLETVPEPTEVNNIAVDTPKNHNAMLPRSVSRYVPPLR